MLPKHRSNAHSSSKYIDHAPFNDIFVTVPLSLLSFLRLSYMAPVTILKLVDFPSFLWFTNLFLLKVPNHGSHLAHPTGYSFMPPRITTVLHYIYICYHSSLSSPLLWKTQPRPFTGSRWPSMPPQQSQSSYVNVVRKSRWKRLHPRFSIASPKQETTVKEIMTTKSAAKAAVKNKKIKTIVSYFGPK